MRRYYLMRASLSMAMELMASLSCRVAMEQGFGDLKRSSRADAIWLAENWSTVGASYSSDVSHPHLLRAAY